MPTLFLSLTLNFYQEQFRKKKSRLFQTLVCRSINIRFQTSDCIYALHQRASLRYVFSSYAKFALFTVLCSVRFDEISILLELAIVPANKNTDFERKKQFIHKNQQAIFLFQPSKVQSEQAMN